MKLKLSTALALVAAAGMTVACGKKKSSSDSSDTPTDQPAPPTDTPATEEEKKAEEKKTEPENVALYKPENLPANFSLQLPGSLAIDTGGASLCLADEGCGEPEVYDEKKAAAEASSDAPVAAEPDSNKSHGLSELRYQLDGIRRRIQNFTQIFMSADTVISANKADCADGCEFKDAKAKMTKEMVNLMIENSGGKEAFDAESLAGLNKLVGTEFVIGDLKVEHPTDDVNGFTTIISVTHETKSSKNAVTLSFNKVGDVYGDIRLKDTSEGSYSYELPPEAPKPSSPEEQPAPAGAGLVEAAAEPKVETYAIDFQLDYKSVKQVLGVVDNSSQFGYKYKNTFTFAADPAKAAVNGTTFSVTIDAGSEDSNSYKQKMSGFADDAGAYMETVYEVDEENWTINKSGTAEAGAEYALFLGEVTIETLNADPWAVERVGGFYGEDKNWYHGPRQPIPAGGEFKVFKTVFSCDETTGECSETFSASGLTISSITLTSETHKSGYSEQVDAKGDVIAYCFYEAEAISADGKFGDSSFCSDGYKEDYAYAESYDGYTGEDGSLEVKGATVTTISASMASLDGFDFYIVRKQDNPDTFAAQLKTAWNSDEYMTDVWDQVIGNGYYYGEYPVDENADPNSVYSIYFSADPSEAADAQIYLRTYDEDFNVTFLPIGGTVTVEVVE